MKIQAPVTKNETVEVTIEDLTYQGMGVAKVEDFPIFIAEALPGEQVIVKITKVQKSFSFGRVEKWLTESKDRVKTGDQKLTQTGIAPLQHLSYEAQLKFKHDQIQNLLNKTSLNIDVLPTIGMDNPTHYRNKAQVPVRMVKGQLQTGFYRQHSHELVPIEDYYIQDPKIDEAIVVVRDLMRKYHIEPFNEINHTGVVRNIMVRRGHYSNEMMIGFVTRTQKLPMADELVKEITAQLPEVTSIVQNINQAKTNVIMGKINKVLFGKETISDDLLGLTFVISPNSFYQVNPVQTEKLYKLAIEQVGLSGKETVIDAYCGIGTISLAMAEHAKSVYGVEIVADAIEDAKVNAQKNHINNVHFEVGKAEEKMGEWQEAGLEPDVIVVDPPRKGLTNSLIESAAKMQPKKVVYVSCNPATLVRDIELFAEQGYTVKQPIQPVDQFPQTTHVESVTVLERKK
ncbi:23S rRNA (uracil(1939)-C(5))-methyltransferase RlmD [Secundilactobacillus oryzae]|nr:23S rRNA (uracil(1939)-C(5))-methyltransferase RlmD [Secundilactobacillus oryzae]